MIPTSRSTSASAPNPSIRVEKRQKDEAQAKRDGKEPELAEPIVDERYENIACTD